MNYEELYKQTGDDTMIFMGGEVKSIGDRKVGGYLVLFTDAKSPDLAGDFFRKSCDFDLEDGPTRRTGYYNHGMDVKIGNKKIGTGTLEVQDAGVWLEAQLKDRDAYIDAVLDMVNNGACGLSSGACGHLVRREKVSKSSNVHEVTHWPISEWSLTPTPCEVRTQAMPLKMWAQKANGVSAKNLNQLHPSAAFIERFGPVDGWSEKEWWQWLNGSQDDLEALTQADETPAPKGAVSISTLRELESFLHRDGGYTIQQSKAIVSRFSLRDVESAPEDISDTFRGDALRELARTELQYLRQAGVAL